MEAEEIKKAIGERIGEGSVRIVYSHKTDSTLVIKVLKSHAREKNNQHNFKEWHIWNNYPELRKYLVPCIAISPCGTYLIQKRGERVSEGKKRLPALLNSLCRDNTKKENWVWYKGRRRLCDYGCGVDGW